MNGRERYRRMLAGEPADFLPRLPLLMQFAAEFIGENYARFASDYRMLVKANLACAKTFGLDQVSAISDPYRETHGFGGEVIYVPDGPPRCPRPPLAESKDLSRLGRPDPLGDPRMLDRVRAVRAFREEAGEYSILGWIEGPAAEAADLRGVTNFIYDLTDDDAFAAALMDTCLDTGIAFARAQVEAGADTVGIGDAIASQLSPTLYEKLVQPREKKMIGAIHAMGARARLHICGNIIHLLPGIADLGVDILDVDHMVDMAAVRRAVGSGTALAGNLDPAAAVLYGTPDVIRSAVRKIYDTVGNPFAVAAGCEIPAGTPRENLLALCAPVPYRPE